MMLFLHLHMAPSPALPEELLTERLALVEKAVKGGALTGGL
jgi:hypothetical protein